MSTASSPSSLHLPRPGDMIAGKYVLDRLLGKGGMGAVFAARHVKLGKHVAIKIMLADSSSPEAAQRFINEGRAAANIQNEHVVRVDDVDEEMGYAYMVLELLEGEDLSQVLERELTKRLAPHVAVGYVVQALQGVMQAHAIGIVHRDLKPSNLFLARRKDGSVVVKVLDFGISKAQGSSALAASPSALTSTKAMLGSPLYMSPEQLRSSKSVDHRADIWAMGIILYELITGTLPFMGDNLGELFAAILEEDPKPIRSHVPETPPGLEQVVMRCLQRKPEHRFQSAAELAHALAPFASPQPGFIAHSPGPVLANTAAIPGGGVSGGVGMAVAATTPNPSMPRPPQPGAVTSGSGPRPIAGTVAMSSTPQGGLVQTGSGGWQSGKESSPALPVKSSGGMIALAIAGGLLVLGGIGGAVGYSMKHKKTDDPVVATSGLPSASAPTSAPTPAVPDPPPTVSVAVVPPPATTVAPEKTAAVATVVKRTPPPPPTPTKETTPPPTAKTTEPSAKKPPPPPTPTASNGGLVNTR